jgi:hypothetical protein
MDAGGAGKSAWDRIARLWRALAQPAASAMRWADVAAFVYLLLSGGLALAHSAEWPSTHAWSKGHVLPLAQLAAFALLGLTQLAILISGRRAKRSEGREKACQLVAAYVDEHCPKVQLRHVGVHIWTVAGPPFARYLKRSGNFLLAGERIVWVKGKGVVGATWQDGRPITRDIDAIREKATSREAYEGLGREDTMSLSWEEFGRTPHYRAISGVPLYRRAGVGSTVCGVVAIDLLEPGHFTELRAAVEDPAFAYVIGVCESNV